MLEKAVSEMHVDKSGRTEYKASSTCSFIIFIQLYLESYALFLKLIYLKFYSVNLLNLNKIFD